MKDYYTQENNCQSIYEQLETCYHLWTPENHEIIFTCEKDFKSGMNAMGLAACLHRNVRILTFEIMSNHVHITAASNIDDLMSMFNTFVKILHKWIRAEGRTLSLSGFVAKTRLLKSLEETRNVIVYDNRNGYVVSPTSTPFTYRWGSNRYYFSPDSIHLAELMRKKAGLRERRQMCHSRMADGINDLFTFEGYALPLSFCDVSSGEMLFRDASHYFSKLARNIENSKEIAREISESAWYTDEDLYMIVQKICHERFNSDSPKLLSPSNKLKVAKQMRFDYNASIKQIQRILRIEVGLLSSIGLE